MNHMQNLSRKLLSRSSAACCASFLMFCILIIGVSEKRLSIAEQVKDSKDTSKTDSFDKLIKPIFKTHCFRCHSSRGETEGDVNLQAIASVEMLKKDPELIRTLINVIDLKEMPPQDETQLPPKVHTQILAELRSILHASISQNQTRSHTAIRRMNRLQYNNAIQDLFQLKCVVFTLPERMLRDHSRYFKPATGKMPDTVRVGSRPLGKSQLIEPRLEGVAAFPQDLRAEHGYDNRADHLTMSPLLLESFLTLSRSILDSPDFNEKKCGVWKTFFKEPKQKTKLKVELRNRLRPFLTRAFRRPISDDQLKRYVEFVKTRIDSGESFTSSMKAVASAVIASPQFLYLYDDASASNSVESLNPYNIASRLSFFLWGSLPDQELMDRAADGALLKQCVLLEQVDRMMKDRRLKRFCDSFPTQWLQLDRIVSSVPDRAHFTKFYYGGVNAQYRGSMHMMLEPLLVFETILIEDRSILELIDSKFSYRSAYLNKTFYDEKGKVKKNNPGTLTFNRIEITDPRQGGVFFNPAVMTMTSSPEYTKPITRGAWLTTVLFNNPPEPPPADVPPLSEKPPKEEEHLTLRERLAAHRERADCAGCHEKIDPLGFALENFDPVGRWRDKYENGREVDMSGKLFQKHEFHSLVEFKEAVLTEKDRFTKAFVAHLLSFALARGINASDTIALDKIANNTKENGYRMKALIREIVLSEPFLKNWNPKSDDSNQQVGNK